MELHLFRERVAQAIEQEVAEQEQHQGTRAEGQQPLPMSGRPARRPWICRKEQNLLVCNGEMREGIQIQVRSNILGCILPVVDDWRRKDPQRHQVAENVLQVTKVYRESR